MTVAPVTIDSSADLHDAFTLFRTHGLRRLPVLDGSLLVGMITIDDLLIDLAADLSDLARPITGEILFPHREHPAPPARV